MMVWINVHRDVETVRLDPIDFDQFAFEHGDVLELDAITPADNVIMTPDGCSNFRLADGRALRVPPTMTLTRHKGWLLPEHLVVLTGRGSETLEPFGKAHIASYEKHMGLFHEMDFLEIGCGIGRDVFQLINVINNAGSYVGVDVTREAIVWCEANITSVYPNFRFFHFDAQHELYNPLGAKKTMEFALPALDNSIDRISLGSVFTHLFEEEVSHYMKEISRVLRPDGKAYCSFFLKSPETIEAVTRTNTTPLRFEHAHGDGCFIDNPAYPTGAVAFEEERMMAMIKSAGLRLACPFIPGAWSGRVSNADDGQDVAIVEPDA